MKALGLEEIAELITSNFGGEIITGSNFEVKQPWIRVQTDQIAAVCLFLRDNPECYFDLLNCLTGIDHGPEKGEMEVLYHLTSIPFGHQILLRVHLERPSDTTLPGVPSVSSVWKTAEWHEREAFDLVGIHFEDHPDLRRILLPEDWVGHPLRKDYETDESFHGVKIDY